MFFRFVGVLAWTAICTLTGTVIGATGALLLLPENSRKALKKRIAQYGVDKAM